LRLGLKEEEEATSGDDDLERSAGSGAMTAEGQECRAAEFGADEEHASSSYRRYFLFSLNEC
jgi:hypothetical protein